MKKLTNKEREVMELFWQHGHMFVRELLEHYEEPRPHFNTLSTIVRRLEHEGYIGHKQYGSTYQYHALLFLLPGKWQIEWTNELYHSNDESVSTNYFSDLSISYRIKTYETGLICSNLFGTRNYRRHYTTDYSDVIVFNQLRPREFLVRLFINV